MQIWLQKLLPQHGLSRLMGKLAVCRIVWLKNWLIRCFIHYFKVDMSEAQQPDYRDYEHFNAFFTRPLRPEVRSLSIEPNVIACPVDGTISELGAIDGQRIFQAKRHYYCLNALLADQQDLVALFNEGCFFTAYLAPRDYHRVHMPLTGTLRSMMHVPGSLFSVNPQTVAGVAQLFARNERVVCCFETDHGPMAVIMVGAVIVASIAVRWHGVVLPSTNNDKQIRRWDYANQNIHLSRGDEMGHFAVGSTVIVLLGKDVGDWQSSLRAGDTIRYGQMIGRVALP